MASFATACRLSARLTAKQLRQDVTARGIDFSPEEFWKIVIDPLNRIPDVGGMSRGSELHHASLITYDDGG
jgi:hypothetical protein